MRDIFFIVKGQYSKTEPCFVNGVTHDTSYIGGYDPYNEKTKEWYMLMDCKTFHCVACGKDLNKILNSVYELVMRYKGDAKKYFKHISDTTSDDYYETHYLGHAPLNHEQRVNKAEGRCPRVSPAMRELYRHIYEEYGDYFSDEIGAKVEVAYNDLKNLTPKGKVKGLKKTNKLKGAESVEKVREVKTPSSGLKKTKPKAKLGIKKLKM